MSKPALPARVYTAVYVLLHKKENDTETCVLEELNRSTPCVTAAQLMTLKHVPAADLEHAAVSWQKLLFTACLQAMTASHEQFLS